MKKMICIGMVLLVFCIVCFFQPVHINGNSMYPTLSNNDMVFMRRLFLFNTIRRYDIVFFQDPYENDNLLVKRIIAMPSETIYCKDGILYINDIVFEDKLDLDKTTDNFGPITLSDDEYFVLGDNRQASTDSRIFGAIKKSQIKGLYIGF